MHSIYSIHLNNNEWTALSRLWMVEKPIPLTENEYAMTKTHNIHACVINAVRFRIEPFSLVAQLNSVSQYLPKIYHIIK